MHLLTQTLEALKADEGFVSSAYQDSLGYLTIGYGTLIDSRRGGGIDKAEAEYLLRNRVIRLLQRLDDFPWFWRCNENRKEVIANMAYNLGINGLLKFKRMIAAIEIDNWGQAAAEILDSNAARQTGNRYIRLAEKMREG